MNVNGHKTQMTQRNRQTFIEGYNADGSTALERSVTNVTGGLNLAQPHPHPICPIQKP